MKQKPFIKWVGGKTQIINNLIDKFPRTIINYHEIFLGGGSVLLSLLQNEDITVTGEIYAYDINPVLINLYKNIQTNATEVHRVMQRYLTEYSNLTGKIINKNPSCIEEALTSKESYYYWLREIFNNLDKSSIECSALFMLINKICFRGMYREGPNGFNIPYGHYKTTPVLISKEDLEEVSKLIRNVNFVCADFKESIKNVGDSDFVYLDPPYAPVNSDSFVGYTLQGFDLNQHKSLFNLIDKLNDRGIKLILSNAKVQLVTDHFSGRYNINSLTCRRSINAKNPESTATEVIVFN